MILLKKRWSPIKLRKRKTVVKRFTKSLKIKNDIVLVAPFEKEKTEFSEKLLQVVGAPQARFDPVDSADTLRVLPLGKKADTPRLYSLRGFHESENSEGVRSYLGMQTDAPDMSIQQLHIIPTDACLICVLDSIMTPLFYKALSEDTTHLRTQFPERLKFACLNHDKLQNWPVSSQQKRRQLLSQLIGDTPWFDCSRDDGISKIIADTQRE